MFWRELLVLECSHRAELQMDDGTLGIGSCYREAEGSYMWGGGLGTVSIENGEDN